MKTHIATYCTLSKLILLLLFSVATAGNAAASSVTCPPKPDTRKAAIKLANQFYRKGIKAFKQKQYERAHQAFTCAQKTLPANLTLFWIGRCAARMGRKHEALQAFEKVLKKPPQVVDTQKLKKRVAALRRRIGAAKPRPRPRPRPHRTPSKSKPRQADGLRTKIMRISTWACWGLGAALLITGTALGSVALHDQSKLENASDGTWWDPGLEKRYERRPALMAGTWVSFGLGAAAVATGTILYFVNRSESKEKQSVAPKTTVSLIPTRKGALAGVRLEY